VLKKAAILPEAWVTDMWQHIGAEFADTETRPTTEAVDELCMLSSNLSP
jgi:hypothetical protein